MKSNHIIRIPGDLIEDVLKEKDFRLVNQFYQSADYKNYIDNLVKKPKVSDNDKKNQREFYSSLSYVEAPHCITSKNVKEIYGKLCRSFEKCMKSKIPGEEKLLISRGMLYTIKPLGFGSFDFEMGKDSFAERNDKTVKQDIAAINKITDNLYSHSRNILVDLDIRLTFTEAMENSLHNFSTPYSKASTKSVMNKVEALARACKKLV